MRFFTTIFALLLGYIVAALLFWGVSLSKQSGLIHHQELLLLRNTIDSMQHPQQYGLAVGGIEHRFSSRKKQYIAEGATFFAIILIGAGIVYTSFRRSISLSRQQNNFMLAVTHELKSPIAGMKLSLETIQRRQLSDEQKAGLIARTISEADRLSELSTNMLIASQMEGRQYKPAKEELDFSMLVQDSVKAFESRYGSRFTKAITEDCDVKGDVTLLQMAVNNLLENAVKYTPPGSAINVSVSRKEKTITLEVADGGGGIPEAEKRKIFRKFYRIGNEETRAAKGTGLGLYLTSKIVAGHGGKIAVRSNQPAGSVFQICLPAVV